LSRSIARHRAIRGTGQWDDPDRLWEFFEPPSLGAIFRPLQNRAEATELYKRVRSLRPRTVLEIGTNNGGTLFLLCRAAAPGATVISLDLPLGRFGGGYSILKIPYFKAFASDRQRVELLRADSHDPAALSRVRRALGRRPLDFLFIDGDHSYAGVRQDFYTFGPLVRRDGLIALHDILPAPEEIGGGVPRFWSEIKSSYGGEELVHDRSQGKMGIGLIRVAEAGVTPGGETE
jgi:predicted O-methyltransferase YrrM